MTDHTAEITALKDTIKKLETSLMAQTGEVNSLKAIIQQQQDSIATCLGHKDEIKKSLASISALDSRVALVEKTSTKGAKGGKGANAGAKAPGNTHQRWCSMWRDEFDAMKTVTLKYDLLSRSELKGIITKVSASSKTKGGNEKSIRYQVGKGTWSALSEDSKAIWKGFCSAYDDAVATHDGESVDLIGVEYVVKTTAKSGGKRGGKEDINESSFLKGLSGSDDEDDDAQNETHIKTVNAEAQSSGSDSGSESEEVLGLTPNTKATQATQTPKKVESSKPAKGKKKSTK